MNKAARMAPLAKLSRPKVHRALHRERLFARLDQSGRGAAAWLHAPPGAGKSTLLSTYVESRKLTGIWYQLDGDDRDPSTFFYYLSEAERSLRGSRRRRPLPLLTPEHLLELEEFARRFFRELYARLGSDAALVFDNFQDVPEDSPLPPLILLALAEIPEGVSVLIASRAPPPPGCGRLTAHGALAVIDWDEIKLNEDEAARITASRIQVAPEASRSLHERSGGWAAGLVLLIERLRRGAALTQLLDPEALQGVFDYFTDEFFRHSDEDDRALLLQLAHMPSFSEDEAVRLTGNERAGRLLESLFKRHLFIERRRGAVTTYQFHALLLAYLRNQARNALSEAVRAGIAHRAAGILQASGQIEEAMRLYLGIRDHDAARALILTHGQSLIAQGRWQILLEWIHALAPERLAKDHWLLYWLGSARVAVNPVAARGDLERAFETAVAAGDAVCECAAAAGMVHAHMLEYVAYRPLDRWIGVLEKVPAGSIRFPSLEAELHVQSALLAALAYRNPTHPGVEATVERLFELVRTGADASARFSGALYLTLYGGVSGPSAVSERAAPLLRALLDRPEISPLQAAFGWFVLSFHYLLAHRQDDCELALAQVSAIGTGQGLPFVLRFAAIIGTWLELARGDFTRARRLTESLEKLIDPANLYDVASVHWVRGQAAIMQRRLDEAIAEASSAVKIFDEAGTHFHRVTTRNILVWAHIHRKEYDLAREWIRDARAIAGPVLHNYTEQIFHGAQAWMALDEGEEPAAVRGLVGCFALGSQRYRHYAFGLWRAIVPRLGAAALERDIESEAVKDIIRLVDCPAPADAPAQWPWKVRVFALGALEIQRDDEPLSFGAKTPRKPLALLKALVCAGGSMRDYHLIDALWPNEEADAARSAFGVALHRLRSLLGAHDVVQSKGGVVSLNPRLVWVDALAFDRLAGSRGVPANGGDAQRALALYRGELLPEERDESWSVAARERLRGKFVALATQSAQAAEARGDWQAAIEIHTRSVDLEPLAESLYQGLMRCHAALGHLGECGATYRRLCQVLAANLGTLPSKESQRLRAQLLGEQEPTTK